MSDINGLPMHLTGSVDEVESSSGNSMEDRRRRRDTERERDRDRDIRWRHDRFVAEQTVLLAEQIKATKAALFALDSPSTTRGKASAPANVPGKVSTSAGIQCPSDLRPCAAVLSHFLSEQRSLLQNSADGKQHAAQTISQSRPKHISELKPILLDLCQLKNTAANSTTSVYNCLLFNRVIDPSNFTVVKAPTQSELQEYLSQERIKLSDDKAAIQLEWLLGMFYDLAHFTTAQFNDVHAGSPALPSNIGFITYSDIKTTPARVDHLTARLTYWTSVKNENLGFEALSLN